MGADGWTPLLIPLFLLGTGPHPFLNVSEQGCGRGGRDAISQAYIQASTGDWKKCVQPWPSKQSGSFSSSFPQPWEVNTSHRIRPWLKPCVEGPPARQPYLPILASSGGGKRTLPYWGHCILYFQLMATESKAKCLSKFKAHALGLFHTTHPKVSNYGTYVLSTNGKIIITLTSNSGPLNHIPVHDLCVFDTYDLELSYFHFYHTSLNTSKHTTQLLL